MKENPFELSLLTVLAEILHGAQPDEGLLLNPGDDGLLQSLDRLSAEEASSQPDADSASIAAHTDHLRYGLSLINRWSQGEEPYQDADWTQSWRLTQVSDSEWSELRSELRGEADGFESAVRALLEAGDPKSKAAIASVAHLAYHLGASRQINRALRGPNANDVSAAA